MKCPNCHNTASPRWQFCPDCGKELLTNTPILVKCPVCNKNFLPGAIKNHINGSARNEFYHLKASSPHHIYLQKLKGTERWG